MTARHLGAVVALLGSALVVASNLAFGSYGHGAFLPLIGFTLAALVPYAILYGVSRSLGDAWVVAGAGAAALAVEAGIRASVFLFPRGSTAAIALVFSPAFIAVIAMPAGAVAGFVAGRLWPRVGGVGRLMIGTAAVTILALIVVGLGRPDLFPTTVARRRAQLARIGEPRIVVGGDRFEASTLWPQSGWFEVGPFTNAADEDVVFVDRDAIRFVDQVDGHVREATAIASDARRKWNWSTRLVRLDGGLALAQTGGGYQNTEVIGLDGGQIWRYRPRPDLPPTAMLPADLDGDGRTEFYVSDQKGVARLDERGQEVWRRDKPMAHIVGAVRDSTGRDGRVLGYVYGDRAYAWTPGGDGPVAVDLPRDAYVIRADSWLDEPAFVLGGEHARVIDLHGRTRLDAPFGDFRVSDAVALRTGNSSTLAVLGTTPREVNRWRLALLQSGGDVIFDQISSAPIRLLKVRNAAGDETLLVAGDQLRALRRRKD